MMSGSFNLVLLVAIKNWKILMATGMLSIASGVYIVFISFEIYSEIPLLLGFTFIMACFSGVVFSLNAESHDIWITYLIYAGLLFTLEIFLFIYYNINVLLFVIGSLSLFRFVQLFGAIHELKKYKMVTWRLIFIISLLGVLFSVVLVINPMLPLGMSESTMIAVAFLLFGISSMLLAKELRKVNRFHCSIERLVKELKEKDILYR
ncbi:hypothetical protein HZP25_15695 [Elizabethkingia anophelis]|nr:hypothetical protein [Elizabethkingia anophelis]